jgi:hypothetical protein
MNRRNVLPLIAAFAGVAATANAAGTGANPLMDLLNASMKEKKGVNVYVKGQQIALVVTVVGQDFIEGRNREQSKIVIRLAAIDAVTMA